MTRLVLAPQAKPQPALTPGQRDLLRILGYSYQHNGRNEHAATIFAALHALDPTDAFSARSLARAQVRSGRAAQALPLLARLVEDGDDSALTHLLHGQALEALGRLPEAARAMEAYVAARAEEARPRES